MSIGASSYIGRTQPEVEQCGNICREVAASTFMGREVAKKNQVANTGSRDQSVAKWRLCIPARHFVLRDRHGGEF